MLEKQVNCLWCSSENVDVIPWKGSEQWINHAQPKKKYQMYDVDCKDCKRLSNFMEEV